VKRLAIVLAALSLAIQWPLWFGHGGWLRVWTLQRTLQAQDRKNADLRAGNAALSAEIASLHGGSEAIEERARHDLHMIKPGEVYFQFAPPAQRKSGGAGGAPPSP
jgi:cell division protein FtsB